MRLYKAVLLANLAFALGLLGGYPWWREAVDRAGRERAVPQQATTASPAADRRWTVKGIVRKVDPKTNLLLVTHEEIPGVMRAMTMGFPANNPKLLRGLRPGDLIEFTLQKTGGELQIVAILKEEER